MVVLRNTVCAENAMTQNTAMKGEKIYEIELDLIGVTDYGVSMDALLTGREAVPWRRPSASSR
jgi:hypothetical protein